MVVVVVVVAGELLSVPGEKRRETDMKPVVCDDGLFP